MNTQSINARRVADADCVREPGDFCVRWNPGHDQAEIWILLPGDGPHDKRRLPLCGGQSKGPDTCHWGWDGNEDRPTLTGSILGPGVWHGYLRAGRLESC